MWKEMKTKCTLQKENIKEDIKKLESNKIYMIYRKQIKDKDLQCKAEIAEMY